MTNIGQRFLKQAMISTFAVSAMVPVVGQAQPFECSANSISASRLATQAVAAAVVTGIEYGDMTRQGSWQMAQESNRAAVLADPSSHLHALGSYHMARNLGASSCLSDADARRSALKGAAISVSIGIAKEMSDGFYNGFSTTDLAVDMLGAGYAVAQAYVPALQHITPTFSVAPQAFTTKNGPRGALTNYANQTVWLSANMHDLLPTSAARAWPSPLRLSVGRRAYSGSTPSDYVVGLDVDFDRLPGSNPTWVRVKHLMHNVRLPGPAMVINARGTRTVGLYW
jgi:uncharacterized protein YfiM (DUF2279 family)